MASVKVAGQIAGSLEEIFGDWAKPPGKAEQERCENTERAVRKAIDASGKLNRRNISVFVHGSFRNHVNVRAESDVDVGVLCRDTFFFELPEGYSREHFGITPATYDYAQFKNEVGEALVSHFGAPAVRRGDKAFDVRENTYRVAADVAPFFEYKVYTASGPAAEGVKLITDASQSIVNWPEQNYANGVAKNDATSRAYKGVVRILKRLCVEMENQCIAAARGVCGFLIECMVYNTPDTYFAFDTWRHTAREVLAFVFNNTLDDQHCSKWTEVNERKWLFHPTQKWTRSQAHSFADAAWNYLGLQ